MNRTPSKSNLDAMIEAALAAKTVTVQKVAAASADDMRESTRSYHDSERSRERGESTTHWAGRVDTSEQEAEAKQEAYHSARHAGNSVSDALDSANHAARNVRRYNG